MAAFQLPLLELPLLGLPAPRVEVQTPFMSGSDPTCHLVGPHGITLLTLYLHYKHLYTLYYTNLWLKLWPAHTCPQGFA